MIIPCVLAHTGVGYTDRGGGGATRTQIAGGWFGFKPMIRNYSALFCPKNLPDFLSIKWMSVISDITSIAERALHFFVSVVDEWTNWNVWGGFWGVFFTEVMKTKAIVFFYSLLFLLFFFDTAEANPYITHLLSISNGCRSDGGAHSSKVHGLSVNIGA